MHVGWAVEGAIGSSLKIDATYISPHVDMADRLEASSKKYACSLILSHWFVELLSPAGTTTDTNNTPPHRPWRQRQRRHQEQRRGTRPELPAC